MAQGAIAQGQSYTNSAIAAHLTDHNPHQITPEAIAAVSDELVEASFSYGAGWSQYSSGYAVKATKLERLVVLEGLMNRTSSDSTDREVLFLPVGFRPRFRVVFYCLGINNGQYQPLRVNVQTNGAVSVPFPAIALPIPWISGNGISFIAA